MSSAPKIAGGTYAAVEPVHPITADAYELGQVAS